MKGTRNAIVAFSAAFALLASLGCASTHPSSSVEEVSVEATVSDPHVAVHVSYFHRDLAPYGRWIEYKPYGWCWTPYDAPAGWRPYYDGAWAYTEYGWSWVSNEPWGWATYHYGRWAFDPHYGWVWVPGSVWAPAWVAWHHGNGWAGWAPLPPDAHWDHAKGLRFRGVDRIPPGHWCFAEQQYLAQSKLKIKIVTVARNEGLLKQTRDRTRYAAHGGQPVNEGLDFAEVEKSAGRKIPRLKVADVGAPAKGRGERVASGRVEYYRPEVRDQDLRMEPPAEIRKPEVTMTESELRKQADRDRAQLEESIAKERAALDREHARELEKSRGPQASVSAKEVEKRQAAEKEAFEQHAAQQRAVLEERHEKQIVKQKPSASKSKGTAKSKGK
jgi:hypothetical protein